MKLKIALIYLFVSFFSINLLASYDKSVVRISSTLSLYDYKYPWKDAKKKNVVGSGVIIENKYILTSAHVVLNANKIEVKKSNEKKRYFAKIKHISYQSDLAILELYDKEFFKNTKPLKLSLQGKKGDEITVSGYPFARNDLLEKNGKISKYKYQDYSLSNESLLALELDISINEGFSGGAVIDTKENLIGIAMQVPKDASRTAFAIPASNINVFFEDIKDGKIDLFHSTSNRYEFLENKTLQKYYEIDKKAVLVTHIDIEEKQLKTEDIILEINGKKVSDISEEEFYKQFHKNLVGDSIRLSILRNKKIVSIDYKLYYSKKFIVQEFNSKPRYFVFGGLVFAPITRNYLKSIGMKQYEMNMLFYEQKRTIEMQEPVAWIENKFENEINKGYNSKVEIVDKINNMKVESFIHFKKLIHNSKEKYIVIDFKNNKRVVFEKDEAIKSFEKIKNKNNL